MDKRQIMDRNHEFSHIKKRTYVVHMQEVEWVRDTFQC